MPLGTLVRRILGPAEPVAIRIYRGLFIDLDAVAAAAGRAAPGSRRILEIGCGDGAMASAMLRRLPEAQLLGIDPGARNPGGMYDGDPSRAQFEPVATTQLIDRGVQPFDLVMLVDVLHHVADSERAAVLRDAAALTAPGGTLVVEEWERRAGLGNKAAFVADRYVSGDVTVRFMTPAELDGLTGAALPGWTRTTDTRIPPRRANRFQSFRRPTA